MMTISNKLQCDMETAPGGPPRRHPNNSTKSDLNANETDWFYLKYEHKIPTYKRPTINYVTPKTQNANKQYCDINPQLIDNNESSSTVRSEVNLPSARQTEIDGATKTGIFSQNTAFRPIKHTTTNTTDDDDDNNNSISNNNNNNKVSISPNKTIGGQYDKLRKYESKMNSTPNLFDFEPGRMRSRRLNVDEKTQSMEELMKRQQKLDHLQHCLQRYEIERREAGEAIKRIEQRMKELEARTNDILGIISKPDENCESDRELSMDDALRVGHCSTVRPQNNYMYVDYGQHSNTRVSQNVNRSEDIRALNINKTFTSGVDSPEAKRNMLLEHLMAQRQRLSAADSSVLQLGRRLMMLSSVSKSQENSPSISKYYTKFLTNPENVNQTAIKQPFNSISSNNTTNNSNSSSSDNVTRNRLMVPNRIDRQMKYATHSRIKDKLTTNQNSMLSAWDSISDFSNLSPLNLHKNMDISQSTRQVGPASDSGYIDLANTTSLPFTKDFYLDKYDHSLCETTSPDNSHLDKMIYYTDLSSDSTGQLAPNPIMPLNVPPLPPKPNQYVLGKPQICNMDTQQQQQQHYHHHHHHHHHPQQQQQQQQKPHQEQLSAEDEEVYKFMSRSYDNEQQQEQQQEHPQQHQQIHHNDKSMKFTRAERDGKFTESTRRPPPPPYYVNLSDPKSARQSNQKLYFQSSTNQTTAVQIVHPTTTNTTTTTKSICSPTEVNLLGEIENQQKDGQHQEINRSVTEQAFCCKSTYFGRVKSDVSIDLYTQLERLNHPVKELAIANSMDNEAHLTSEHHSTTHNNNSSSSSGNNAICFTTKLGNWLTGLATNRINNNSNKPQQLKTSFDYLKCQIVLTNRLCAGYLWLLKKPIYNKYRLWETFKRRMQTSTSPLQQSLDRQHLFHRTKRARWHRKWISCDMNDQKISISECKIDRVDLTIHFTSIKNVYLSSTEELLEFQNTYSVGQRLNRSSTLWMRRPDEQQYNDRCLSDFDEFRLTCHSLDKSNQISRQSDDQTETLFCLETALHIYFMMAQSPALTRLWIDVFHIAMKSDR